MKKNDLLIIAFLVLCLAAVLVAFLRMGGDEAEFGPQDTAPFTADAPENARRNVSPSTPRSELEAPGNREPAPEEKRPAPQRTKTLEGRVLDLQGRPISGAHVIYRAVLEDRSLRLEARTDVEGRYRLRNIRKVTTKRQRRITDAVVLVRADGFVPRRLLASSLALADPSVGDVVRRDFLLGRGGVLRIHVVDAVEGLPIPGARVTIHEKVRGTVSFDLDGPVASLTTDADGVARLAPFVTSEGGFLASPGSVQGVFVRAAYPKHAASGAFAFPVEHEGETRDMEIRLPPGATLKGRVLGPKGHPRARAIVEVELEGWPTSAVCDVDSRSRSPLPRELLFHAHRREGHSAPLRTLTDAEGSYVFEELPVEPGGMTSARIEAMASNLTAREATAILVGGETTFADDLRLAIDPDVLVVKGVVQDEKARPVAGAHIAIEGVEPVRTDAEGRFEVIIPPRSRPRQPLPAVTVEAGGYARWARTVPDPLPADGIHVVLKNPHVLEGRVVDAAGVPVARARVTAADMASKLVATVATDEEGRFRFTALPDSRFRMSARLPYMDSLGMLPGLGRANVVENVVPGTEDLELRFPKTAPAMGALRVALRDARDGRPILAKSTVKLIQGTFQRSGMGQSVGTVVFPRVPAGDCMVTAEAEGYLPASAGVAVAVRLGGDAEPTTLEFRLEPAVGIIVKEDVVDAQALGSPARMTVRWGDTLNPVLGTRTLPVGEPFRFENLRPGTWTVSAEIRVAGKVVRVAQQPVTVTLAPRSGLTQVHIRLVPGGGTKTSGKD